MSIGKFARKLLGSNFYKIAKYYKEFFFHIPSFVEILPKFPANTTILDVGGGDGEVLNYVLSGNPTLKAVLIDPNDNIGGMISTSNRKRVTLYPGYSMQKYKESNISKGYQFVLISDVLHHIPEKDRDRFINELLGLCLKDSTLIIKDIQPGYVKSWLSLFSDIFISGDKSTKLISMEEITKKIRNKYPKVQVTDTGLQKKTPPNYCLLFSNFK
ncbi:class I SAM-dependent methyltransferase [Candidatus Dojkabacteria bacterium]|nr:class I SAM-dependent methyltransferase [Candidatus Dojkabacteria bacterium]